MTLEVRDPRCPARIVVQPAATVTMGWGGNPALRAALGPKGHLFGTVLHVAPSGVIKKLADVAAHEAAQDPSGGNVDSNLYNTLTLPGRRIVAACPGGAPTVLLEGLFFRGGVASGPDGAVYLTNFGVSATAGEVLRLDVAPCS